MAICEIGWCLGLASDGSTKCVVHQKFPDYRPESQCLDQHEASNKFTDLVKALGDDDTDCPSCDGLGHITVDAEAECGLCEGSGTMSAEQLDDMIVTMTERLEKAVARRKSIKAMRAGRSAKAS